MVCLILDLMRTRNDTGKDKLRGCAHYLAFRVTSHEGTRQLSGLSRDLDASL